jgi:hypothetical protein
VGYQNEAYCNAQEYELLVRICKHHQVAFLNIPTYLYRYHDAQLSMVGSPMSKEKIRTKIRIDEVFLQAVLDWGYSDTNYYDENSEWIDRRIAELYHCIGERWLDIDEVAKARAAFRCGQAFESSDSTNINMLRLSFLPKIARRIVTKVLTLVNK